MQLLRRALVLGSGAAAAELFLPAQFLSSASAQSDVSAVRIQNPLAEVPDRSWERIYRDQFSEDSSFVFTCAPNDTHNCLLEAHVKNGVIVRISPTYGYGKAKDLYGNQASHRWDPRICQKGLILGRRIYGDRRVKEPMIRKGFKEWADDGFPRNSDGSPKSDMSKRGYDEWLAVGWDEAFSIAAKTMQNVAETYNGEEGSEKLLEQGYEPAMVEAMHGAGVQAIKMRGGMPLLGVGRVFGFYRIANMLALLDRKQRPDVLLAGERDGVLIKSELTGGVTFDLGNSPREFTRTNVSGKTIVTTGFTLRAVYGKLDALELGKIVVSELLRRSEIDPKEVDEVIYGTVIPSVKAANIAREIVLGTGLPRSIPGFTVSRACASSNTALTSGADMIARGYANTVVVGGAESLSTVPILFSRRFAEVLVAASRQKTMSGKLGMFRKLRPNDLAPDAPRSRGIGHRPNHGRIGGDHEPRKTESRARRRTGSPSRATSARRGPPPKAGSRTR